MNLHGEIGEPVHRESLACASTDSDDDQRDPRVCLAQESPQVVGARGDLGVGDDDRPQVQARLVDLGDRFEHQIVLIPA